MATAPGTDLDALRRQYEHSLSWRVTRPLRAVGRQARAITRTQPEGSVHPAGPSELSAGRYDLWLAAAGGDALDRIEAECADGRVEHLARFRSLDDDLWALLLTQEQEAYPNISALLPAVPDPVLQEIWNGASGAALAAQSKAFYAKVRGRFARHAELPLAEARVLDFGCGWGRLTRFFARDVVLGALFGCDPVEEILDVCRTTRVPATLARSAPMPERLPFDERFDLAYAFSVFTHLSEPAVAACMGALHAALRPGGLLVATIRPPEYLRQCPALHPALEALGPDPAARLREPRLLFAPHDPEERHPQYDGGDMHYGETVITLPYVRERWTSQFELVDVDLLVGDLHQVVITLRRR